MRCCFDVLCGVVNECVGIGIGIGVDVSRARASDASCILMCV